MSTTQDTNQFINTAINNQAGFRDMRPRVRSNMRERTPPTQPPPQVLALQGNNQSVVLFTTRFDNNGQPNN